MTAPVLARVQSGNVTVGFYNPYKYQGPTGSAAPAPTDPSVYIQQLPSLEVYVLSYGGLTSSATQKQKRDELAAALKAAKLPFDSSTWFTAGYDAPYQLLNRHNEVMIPATPVAPAAPATAPAKAVPAAAAKASPVAAAAKAATASPAAKPALTSPVAKPAAAGRKLKL
ncbi:heme binding protein 2 [Monoraphidium neglectum]|uniref:Heme binding protein 2 n=1 Tax=Monoraphidium neglectum TaxID=145388 RepID=A0A0D2JEH2_9CHLO|nr:heme binding protein 2 [Monoraphidium neglectum]KIY97972.1 heme binding protein 2 [Monoraphidium neglectum]|eukprot:XP_013896992.1 heme binding protein 2 [Monoraphidium neglectum]